MPNQSLRVLLLGATGTIGRATAAALIAAGHEVVAVVRPGASGPAGGARLEADVTQAGALAAAIGAARFDAVISCLASRTGAPRDAWAIDHRANSLALAAAIAADIPRFVLLSAICVQKPLLEFQRAKLAFEAELQAEAIKWSIVRPTAFFKSLSGQVARVQAGRPFLVFGDGRLTACLTDPALENRILPIGGPGPAITPLDQAQLLERLTDQPVRLKRVPVALMDGIIAVLSALDRLSPKLAEKANLARIGRYYATESMLVLNPATGQYEADATPEFGADRLADHYAAMLNGTAHDDRGAHKLF
jgi:divinyl chlorophyllide a 8-vinyl-reductase